MEWNIKNNFTLEFTYNVVMARTATANTKQVIQINLGRFYFLLKNCILSHNAILIYFANYIFSICFWKSIFLHKRISKYT